MFDVFLSYKSSDHEHTEKLARWLQEQQLGVFLDRWYLNPGLPWPQALEEALAQCRAIAICIGPGELGPWQRREMYLALDRQARDAAFPVIPVLLPGSEPVLGFLNQNTWVDLRRGSADTSQLRILAKAINGEPPGPDLRDQGAATLAALCPYRGLRFFREEDEAYFFGREAAIASLDDALSRRSFVALVGASGSGKSSVVRAGLVPRLRRGSGGRVWEVATLVPSDRPLHSLGAALLLLLEPKMTETDRIAEVGKFAQQLSDPNSGSSLADFVHRALEKQPGTDRLLLVVDQWEELYTLTRDENARTRFIDELLKTSQTGKVKVLLTLRGDFFGSALAHRQLSDRLQDSTVNLPPMDESELRRVIREPALRVGLHFQDGLVELILRDVQSQPGSLPLLEFVLERLWKERRGTLLSHEAYTNMSGVKGALAHKADSILQQFSPLEQEAVQRIFLQLVRPGAGTEDTRRRAPLAEIPNSARPLLKVLADERLLVTARNEATGEETVEVSHEALIRNWKQLVIWVNADREFLLWRERLRSAVAEWLRTGRDQGSLLRGALLAEAERWVAQRQDHLAGEEREFISKGVELRTHEGELDRGRRTAQKRQQQRIALALAGIVVVLAALAIILVRNHYADRAVEAERMIQQAESDVLREPSRALAWVWRAYGLDGNVTPREYAVALDASSFATGWQVGTLEHPLAVFASKSGPLRFFFVGSARIVAVDLDSWSMIDLWRSNGTERLESVAVDAKGGSFAGILSDKRALVLSLSPSGALRTVAFPPELTEAGAIAISSDEATIAVARKVDHALWTIDVASGAAKRRHDGENFSLSDQLLFSPTDRNLLVHTQGSGRCRTYHLDTGVENDITAALFGDSGSGPHGTAPDPGTPVDDEREVGVRDMQFSTDGELLVLLYEAAPEITGHQMVYAAVLKAPFARTVGREPLVLTHSAHRVALRANRKAAEPASVEALFVDSHQVLVAAELQSAVEGRASGWGAGFKYQEIPPVRGEDQHTLDVLPMAADAYAVLSGDAQGSLFVEETGRAAFVELRGHRSAVIGGRISGDGNWVASVDSTGEMRVWSLAIGHRPAYSPAYFGDARSSSSGGINVLAYASSGAPLSIVGYPAGEVRATFSNEFFCDACLTDSGDAAVAACAAREKTVQLLRTHRDSLSSATQYSINELKCLHGAIVVTGDTSIAFLAPDTLSELARSTANGGRFRAVEVSADRRAVVTRESDNTVTLWTASSNWKPQTLQLPEGPLAVTGDGALYVASTGTNEIVRVTEGHAESIASLPTGDSIASLAVDPSETLVAAGLADGTAALTWVRSGVVRRVRLFDDGGASSVEFSESGRELLARVRFEHDENQSVDDWRGDISSSIVVVPLPPVTGPEFRSWLQERATWSLDEQIPVPQPPGSTKVFQGRVW